MSKYFKDSDYGASCPSFLECQQSLIELNRFETAWVEIKERYSWQPMATAPYDRMILVRGRAFNVPIYIGATKHSNDHAADVWLLPEFGDLSGISFAPEEWTEIPR